MVWIGIGQRDLDSAKDRLRKCKMEDRGRSQRSTGGNRRALGAQRISDSAMMLSMMFFVFGAAPASERQWGFTPGRRLDGAAQLAEMH